MYVCTYVCIYIVCNMYTRARARVLISDIIILFLQSR